MVAELATCAIVILLAGAETLHASRCRRIAMLAFGPAEKPAFWARWAPLLRVAAGASLCWGLVSLLLLDPKIHKSEELAESELRHLVLVLDVSPSMRLQDAGPAADQSRMARAASVMKSFFDRVSIEQYRLSVVACYNGAKPVVEETRDMDVVYNILDELPMQYAFEVGKTDIFAGLQEAARIAHPWPPRSSVLVLVSDGDTVPSQGMPKLPTSISNVLVVGVGDPKAGKFIDGRHSRQDASTLRQVATRLRGIYHNGNEKQIASSVLAKLSPPGTASPLEKLTRREFALIATAMGATILGLLPWLLHLAGTGWRPGVPVGSAVSG